MADRCAASWDLFNKYLSNELASGSEDEKCIRRAKQRALRKQNQHLHRKAKPTKQDLLSLSHLLPQPPRLLVSLSQTPGLILAPLALSANQGQVIFVSPVVNKAIGDPIVKLLLKPNRLALVCSFLVLVVHRPLDVNRRLHLNL